MHTLPYLLITAIPIFPLALAAVDVDGFPFTLRLAFRASSMSVVSSGFSSSSFMVIFCPLDFASISFSSSLAYVSEWIRYNFIYLRYI